MSAPDRANDPKRRPSFGEARETYRKAAGSRFGTRVNELRDKLGRPVNRDEMDAITEGINKEIGMTPPKREDY